jgi:hypothetical protein
MDKRDKFVVVRESADKLKANNIECEQHGGNCCQSGFCCNKPGLTP